MSKVIVTIEVEGDNVTPEDGRQLAGMMEFAINAAGKSPDHTIRVSDVSFEEGVTQ